MQSLRSNTEDAEPAFGSESLRVRRRRENADDERARRRRRRAGQSSTSETTKPRIPTLEEEEGEAGGERRGSESAISLDNGVGERSSSLAEMVKMGMGGAGLRMELETPLGSPLGSPALPSPPITIVSPPSPTISERGGWNRGAAEDQEDEGREVYVTPMEERSDPATDEK